MTLTNLVSFSDMGSEQSSPPAGQSFGEIEDLIKKCINSSLPGKWIEQTLLDIQDSIEFFSKYDFQWAITCIKRIGSEIIWPKVETFYGVMAALCSFFRHVIELTYNRAIALCSTLTIGDIFDISKICIDKNEDFPRKFGKLCEKYVLPKMASAVNGLTGNVQLHIDTPNAVLKDDEIFYAASKAVGSLLTVSNAKIVKGDGEIVVIIKDTKIKVSLLEITRDMKTGDVNATVVHRNSDNVSNTANISQKLEIIFYLCIIAIGIIIISLLLLRFPNSLLKYH